MSEENKKSWSDVGYNVVESLSWLVLIALLLFKGAVLLQRLPGGDGRWTTLHGGSFRKGEEL